MRKKCFKCGKRRDIKKFYRHPQMADGYLNKCKECTKADANAERQNNLEYYRAYDRDRGNRQTADYQRQYRKNNREKYLAQRRVSYAVSAGKLIPQPCEVCGTTEHVHGHHDDVRWLCAVHHKEAHK